MDHNIGPVFPIALNTKATISTPPVNPGEKDIPSPNDIFSLPNNTPNTIPMAIGKKSVSDSNLALLPNIQAKPFNPSFRPPPSVCLRTSGPNRVKGKIYTAPPHPRHGTAEVLMQVQVSQLLVNHIFYWSTAKTGYPDSPPTAIRPPYALPAIRLIEKVHPRSPQPAPSLRHAKMYVPSE